MSKLRAVSEKFRTLWRCVCLARRGANGRSRRLLFYIGILAGIWPARRAALLRHLQDNIARAADAAGVLALQIKQPGKAPGTIFLRAGDRADYQSLWECFLDEVYEAPNRPIEFIFDAGANLGFFSAAFAHRLGAREVILVEPSPNNLELLHRTVKTLPNAKIIEAALSDHEGEATFHIADSNTGHLSDAPAHVGSSETITVPLRRLGDVVPPNWDLSRAWFKIDIEGAEYSVLRDMLQNGMRPAALSIEVHEFPTAGGAELLAEIEAAGYELKVLDHGDDSNVCRQVTALRQLPKQRP